MNDQTTIASMPTAWLQPLPVGHEIPLWRWILVPATTLMLKRNGGVWINGAMDLSSIGLRFTQESLVKSSRKPILSWTISLADISDIDVTKGLASEKIEIHHKGGVAKLMGVRSAAFISTLRMLCQG